MPFALQLCQHFQRCQSEMAERIIQQLGNCAALPNWQSKYHKTWTRNLAMQTLLHKTFDCKNEPRNYPITF